MEVWVANKNLYQKQHQIGNSKIVAVFGIYPSHQRLQDFPASLATKESNLISTLIYHDVKQYKSAFLPKERGVRVLVDYGFCALN